MQRNWPTSFDQVTGRYIKKIFHKSDSLETIVRQFVSLWDTEVVPFYKGEPVVTPEEIVYCSNGLCPTEQVITPVYVLLENSRYYSDRPDIPIELELLLADDFLLTGVYDGGDYFKREDVKICWERRKLHPETYFKSLTVCDDGHTTGRHLGVRNAIYPLADHIYVDTDIGKVILGFKEKHHFTKKPVRYKYDGILNKGLENEQQ